MTETQNENLPPLDSEKIDADLADRLEAKKPNADIDYTQILSVDEQRAYLSEQQQQKKAI